MKIDCLLKCQIEIDETDPSWLRDGANYPGGVDSLVADSIEENFFEDRPTVDNYYNPGSRIVNWDVIVDYIVCKIKEHANTRSDNV
jgi:hypothetical protein